MADDYKKYNYNVEHVTVDSLGILIDNTIRFEELEIEDNEHVTNYNLVIQQYQELDLDDFLFVVTSDADSGLKGCEPKDCLFKLYDKASSTYLQRFALKCSGQDTMFDVFAEFVCEDNCPANTSLQAVEFLMKNIRAYPETDVFTSDLTQLNTDYIDESNISFDDECGHGVVKPLYGTSAIDKGVILGIYNDFFASIAVINIAYILPVYFAPMMYQVIETDEHYKVSIPFVIDYDTIEPSQVSEEARKLVNMLQVFNVKGNTLYNLTLHIPNTSPYNVLILSFKEISQANIVFIGDKECS